jgi:6-phosphogluconolactonase
MRGFLHIVQGLLLIFRRIKIFLESAFMSKIRPPEIVLCTNKEALSHDAACRFVAYSHRDPKAPFRVVLAGGSTPKSLYYLLGEPQFVQSVDWKRVHLFFGDERAVAPDAPESNFRMAYECLVSRTPIPASQIYRMTAEEIDLSSAGRAYERQIREHFGQDNAPQFDLVLLGMGSDGHCASLFPGKRALQEKTRWVVPTEAGLQPFVPRLTLTYPLINQAKEILFLVSGAGKAGTLAQVLQGEHDVERYPAQGIQPIEGRTTWLIDREAGRQLDF